MLFIGCIFCEVIIIEAHIIPQVLQRGFRIDLPEGEKDTKDRKNAKVNIFYNESKIYKKNEPVNVVSTKTDFYGKEMERFLQDKYETPFGNLKSMLNDSKNPRYIRILPNDYELLLTFSANMWRRSDTHLTSEYRNRKLSDDVVKKILYSEKSLDIDRFNPIFLKTSFCYDQYLIYNDTSIKFALHNKHTTIRSYKHIPLFPDFIFEPITNRIMVVHKLKKDFLHKSKKISLETPPNFMYEGNIKLKTKIITKEDIIINIIRVYCLVESSLDYYICDDSNIEYIKELYENSNISKKAIKQFQDKFSKYIF